MDRGNRTIVTVKVNSDMDFMHPFKRRNFMRLRSGLAIAVAAAAVLSCDRDFSGPAGPGDPPAGKTLNPVEKAVVASSNSFGFGLFREVCREEGPANVFVSPLSVSMALGMTLNGADGRTEADMRSVLGFDGLSRGEINAAYRTLLDLLPGLDPTTAVEIANSIWVRLGFPVLPDFTTVNRSSFDADVRSLDFSLSEAPDVINGWIAGKTRGRIDRMIDEIDASTVMFLINAVFFKGTWKFAFDPRSTRAAEFTRSDGTAAACSLMAQTAKLPYLETPAFQAVDLPYGNGRYAMTVLLPAFGSSIETLLAGFTEEAWAAWRGGFETRDVTVQLPKFSLEYRIKLNDALIALGMGVAFGGGADFSRIAEGRDLYISQVLHKAFVQVDERGTEAAAATVVEIRETSAGPQPPVLRADRPFVFVIRERSTDTLLFLGRVEAP
jgi:serpin B